MKPGNPAEGGIVRRQNETSAEFQIAEAGPRRIAIVERRNRRRLNYDARERRDIVRGFGNCEK